MSSEIIVNRTAREIRVALLEHGTLTELHVSRGRERGHVGNVHLGKVVRVLPGMQAAFVEIGLERAAFLYVGDIFVDHLALGRDGDEGVEMADEEPRSVPRAGQPAIQDLLEVGQEIVVQVAKDPMGTKGARITTHVTLPGRYLVFMPTVEHVGISRRVERESERRRLRSFVGRHRPKGGGFIVRTVCQGQPEDVLKQDIDYLVGTWARIQEAAKSSRAPALLHADHGLVVSFLRDNLVDDIERVVVDDREIRDKILEFMGSFMPHFRERVQLYRGKEPIFDIYGVETEIARSLGRKVGLKSGGYLVIDQTEALVAIDVNSGRFVGTSSLEETTTQTNLEAVKEVVHQLRLRNIGGIIIIDFIDMERAANRERVFKALEEETRRDRARTNVQEISELGLVEMTRKRVQEDLDRFMNEPCFYCEGHGVLRSRETLCFDIFRAIQREAANPKRRGDTIFVNAHPRVADLLYGEEFPGLEEVERQTSTRVVVRAMGHFHQSKFEVYSR